MRTETRPRRTIATVLALVLAVESVSAVAVAASSVAPLGGGTTGPVAAPAATRVSSALAGLDAATAGSASLAVARQAVPVEPDVPGDGRVAQVVVPAPPPPPAPAPAATPKPKPQAATATTARFVGRNRLWIPAFGITRQVYGFPCSRTKEPGHVVYRWGCAGRNNVYLFGHASSVFAGLHKAYVTKRLKVGQKAYFADASGKVRTYVVKWWKVVRPDGDVAFAYASLARPSMTLQTCVGRNSEYRLVVRLELAKG